VKEQISALMDGELERREAAGAIGALESEGEARETWRSFHLIGDAMREAPVLSAGFSARVAERLGREPTVLAPRRSLLMRPMEVPAWTALAASLAAVAFVGWVAFEPQESAGPVAKAPVASVVVPGSAVQEAALVAPPAGASDYLRAHQGYSPRTTLQGAAPYVLVDAEVEAPKR
jgi:sigma-E factor negative regulatory protein RseA